MTADMIYQQLERVDRFGNNLVSWARQGSLDSVKRALEVGDNINLQGMPNPDTRLLSSATTAGVWGVTN